MFPQTLSAERTFAVLQSGGKLESGVVQARDQGWLKHGGKTQEIVFLYSMSGRGWAALARQLPYGQVGWWLEKSKVKGRSCRDIVLLPTQYQPVEFAHCMGENTFCRRMDFRRRSDSLHARMLWLLSLESWGANLSLTWVNGFSQELNKLHSLL